MIRFSLFLLIALAHTTFLSAQKLIEAVEAADYQQVEQYLKDGEKVNKTNKKGLFPLWNAVWNRDIKMVELLLKNGADAKQKLFQKNRIATAWR